MAAGMPLKAARDRKPTKARVNWLIRMHNADDPRLTVKARWPGRALSIQKPLTLLREDPGALQTQYPAAMPHVSDFALVDASGKRLAGRRSFIKNLKTIIPTIDDLVGQHLRACHAALLRPVRSVTAGPADPEAQDPALPRDVARDTASDHG